MIKAKKKLCSVCHKRRMDKFYSSPQARICDMCKSTQKLTKKREAKKLTNKYWIKKMDEIIGKLVRGRGKCEDDRLHECRGGFQWAHGFSRRYHHTRWIELNSWCLCAGAHKFYTERPLEWEEFMKRELGEVQYEEMRQLALSNTKIDYEELYYKLKEKNEEN